MAKMIRVLTVAPVMALVMLTVVFIKAPALIGGTTVYVLSVLFLTIFPLLAYPLQPLIPKYKNRGREGQRSLAMIFAVAGYIGGCVMGLLLHVPRSVWVIYLSYLLSGLLIVLFNKLFHFKASGHACGVTGPFVILIFFGQALGYIGVPILAAACWASLRMKRHTVGQLVSGALIPIIALGLAVAISANIFYY